MLAHLGVVVSDPCAVQGQAEPRTNPRHGIIQSQLMDAIYESADAGGAVVATS